MGGMSLKNGGLLQQLLFYSANGGRFNKKQIHHFIRLLINKDRKDEH